jgi:anti-anti-sigma factor
MERKTEDAMEVQTVTESKGIRVLDLFGGLNLSTIENLKRQVAQIAKEDCGEIVLNFASVDHVDSSGLGAVISCYVTLHRQKKKLSLVNLNEKIKEIFFYTHLSKIIRIYEGLDEIRP